MIIMVDTLDLHDSVDAMIRDHVAEHPGWDDAQVAAAVIDSLTGDSVAALGAAAVRGQVWSVKREAARKIEAEAMRRREDQERRQRERDQAPGGPLHRSMTGNQSERKACRTCGCDQCRAALEEYRQWTDDLERRDLDRKLGIIMRIEEEAAERAWLELTEELLGTEFALGDGRRVTWGDATEDDHRQRVELLNKNAAANMEAATRHRLALRMLEKSGAKTLTECLGGPG